MNRRDYGIINAAAELAIVLFALMLVLAIAASCGH